MDENNKQPAAVINMNNSNSDSDQRVQLARLEERVVATNNKLDDIKKDNADSFNRIEEHLKNQLALFDKFTTKEDTETLKIRVRDLETKTSDYDLQKNDISILKKLVYGAVGATLLSVLGAILAVVIISKN